jgi:quercetin dioxygenase-like cupin family protein
MENLRDVRDVGPLDIWRGVTARAIEGERITLAFVELAPNAVVPEHRHPNEQLGIMLQGSGTFRVGDETREVHPGSTWRILSNVPHELTAGPDGAVVIDVFSPVRSDWKRFDQREPREPAWPPRGA